MQGITPPTVAQLLATGQVMLMKFEIYVDSRWINLCNLPPEEGLVGYWPFDIGSGMIAYDHSGYDNDGSLENMEEVDWVDGKVNKALDFDGENDYVDCGNPTEFQMGPNDFSLSFWVMFNSLDAHMTLISKGKAFAIAPYDDYGWNLARFSTNGKLYFDTYKAGQRAIANSVKADWVIDTWYHIVITKQGTVAKIYVDGELDNTDDAVDNIEDALHNVMIARSSTSAAYYLDGIIDEVRIYKRVLTLAEIKTFYNLEIEEGKHYVESISVSLGGASMTPKPIGGKWSARLANEGSIFHPDHPTSGYDGYCVSGREARITIGGTYSGIDYYYQRIIGYMDEPKFSAPDYKVSISGQDYMKRLEDAEFQEMDGTHPNHWGLSTTFDSWPSDGLLGNEMYTTNDAMDTADDGGPGFDNIGTWDDTNCILASLAEAGKWVGKVTGQGSPLPRIELADIGGNATAGRTYRVKFKHKIVGGDGSKGLKIQIFQTALIKQVIYFPTDDWKEETLYFIATDTAAIQMRFRFAPTPHELWLNDISVWEYKPEEDRYYDLTVADVNQKGPYHVTLNLINNGSFIANTNGWTPIAATLTSVAGGQDGNCMKVASSGAALGKAYQDVATVIGNTYKLSLYFQKGTSDTGKFMIGIVADEDSIYDSGDLSDAVWAAKSHAFEATATTTRITMQTTDPTNTENSLFDEIILAEDVQQGEEDEGWWYEEEDDVGPTGHVFFDRNKTVIDGTGLGNVVIHYYVETHPEDAVARILWFAGLGYLGIPYANEAAAKATMDNDDPGFTIDKVWFEAGTSFLNAIRMLCEVCNYRFHFKYTGQPSFKVPPAGGVVFTFSDPSQIASQRTYQSRSEIKNRVIIKGIKRAEPVNLEDSVPSELIGDSSDAASITAYGERTMTITNHLFQTQARINAMCITLRDLYKTPKWYANLKIPFNPVPLELGDEIQWEERLSHDIADKTQMGIIRDIKISNFIVTYKVEITTP